jgi:hypothetical protein
MITSDVQAVDQLRAGETRTAKVALKDGRIVELRLSVQPARPSVALISKSVQLQAPNLVNRIQLTDKDELPLGAVLTFSVHARAPAKFSGRESVEIGNTDGAVMTTLTFTSGLVLQDAQVTLATLDTAQAFNASTFGALQFRIVEDGIAGDWQPLATLVRLPVLRVLKCPAASAVSCELTGSNLFLIESLSGDPRFDHPFKVPDGFTGRVLQIPHPTGSRLFIKLRDDPSAVDTIALPP